MLGAFVEVPVVEDMLVEHRVVQHFRTHLEVHSNGHHRLFVQTLGGSFVGVLDGTDAADVEHQLARARYQRIPMQMADDLDLLRLKV